MARKVKLTDRILFVVAPYLAEIIVRFLYLTMKIEFLHEERARKYWDHDERMILACWHGRLLMIPLAYKGKFIRCLISHHKDGEMLATFMGRFGHGAVRGSSTRGGSMAMREMLRTIRECDIAITPDGPKGPRYIVQDGIVALARMSGAPILPVTFGASRKKHFSSWDSFLMPMPFSHGAFIWGEPIFVSKDDDLEEKKKEVEKSLIELTDYIDDYVSKK